MGLQRDACGLQELYAAARKPMTALERHHDYRESLKKRSQELSLDASLFDSQDFCKFIAARLQEYGEDRSLLDEEQEELEREIHEQQEQQEEQQELQTNLKPSDERDWDIVAAARKGFAANTLTADDRLQSLAELLPPEACKIPWRDSKGRRYRIEPTRIFCKTTSKTNHGDQLPVRLVQSFLLSKNS